MTYIKELVKRISSTNGLLRKICSSLHVIETQVGLPDATQTTLSTTVDGVIPAGAVSYSITNLGANDFTLQGETISSSVQTISNSLSNATFGEISYGANGNTLLVIYTVITG